MKHHRVHRLLVEDFSGKVCVQLGGESNCWSAIRLVCAPGFIISSLTYIHGRTVCRSWQSSVKWGSCGMSGLCCNQAVNASTRVPSAPACLRQEYHLPTPTRLRSSCRILYENIDDLFDKPDATLLDLSMATKPVATVKEVCQGQCP